VTAAAIFRRTGELYEPTQMARGPWDPGALHGGAPAALMASAIEAVQPGGELFVSRLTFEFLRPVPLAALALATRIVRPGRRAQLIEAGLSCDGVEVARAVGLRTVRTPERLVMAASAPEGDGTAKALAGPEEGRPIRFNLTPDMDVGFAAAMDMRFIAGDDSLGPATVWMRMHVPLVDAEPPSALARTVAAADFGNGVSSILDYERHVFINPDLTVYLHRLPVGEWVCLDSRTLIAEGSGAICESALHDEHGRIGRSCQALVVGERP
jgi:Thioesterase-like superfamily